MTFALQGNGEAATGTTTRVASADDDIDALRDEALVCAACQHAITFDRHRTEAFGGHVHDRVNPAGVAFRIGLFSRAEGVVLVGASSDDFAWFPHYHWRIALCGGCSSHVGWSFSGPSSAFYGLVLEALRSAS